MPPHRLERCMQSDHLEFQTEAVDVIGLCVNPPNRAAVFAVAKKDGASRRSPRLDPVLPLSPARAERGTDSSSTVTAHSRPSRRSILNPAKSYARLPDRVARNVSVSGLSLQAPSSVAVSRH